jgi:glycosyltransferase involved in cell wall biosynthesis
MRKQIAIVSSYAEECGVAFYSSRLKQHLESHFDVDIVRLNIWLLRTFRRAGDSHIREIAARLKQYDGVCLQLEPGLYSCSLRVSYRRILCLLEANSNMLVTIHGFYALREFHIVDFVKTLCAGALFTLLQQVLFKYYNLITIKFWARVRTMKNVKLHAFCSGDAAYFQYYFGFKEVSHFPITYYSREEVSAIHKNADRDQILSHYNLDPCKQYIGIYGFLSPYKGHLVALKALEYLPEDYHLLIIGGEHPHGRDKKATISTYLRYIYTFINGDELRQTPAEKRRFSFGSNARELPGGFLYDGLIPNRPLGDRVHFIGRLSDEEMSRFYCATDYVVHPYIDTESGQSASGPAVLAFEFRTRALYSSARVFRQMENYFKEALPFFGIGNYKELAEAIQRYENFNDQVIAARNAARAAYNPETMVAHYIKHLGFETPAKLSARTIQSANPGSDGTI